MWTLNNSVEMIPDSKQTSVMECVVGSQVIAQATRGEGSVKFLDWSPIKLKDV
jgi:hypothetical protein